MYWFFDAKFSRSLLSLTLFVCLVHVTSSKVVSFMPENKMDKCQNASQG